jgi:hypothetical protein
MDITYLDAFLAFLGTTCALASAFPDLVFPAGCPATLRTRSSRPGGCIFVATPDADTGPATQNRPKPRALRVKAYRSGFIGHLAASAARRTRLKQDLPSRLDRLHPRLIAGPETRFAVFGLVVHVVLRFGAVCPAGGSEAVRNVRTTHRYQARSALVFVRAQERVHLGLLALAGVLGPDRPSEGAADRDQQHQRRREIEPQDDRAPQSIPSRF